MNSSIENLELFPLGMTLFPEGIIALNIFEPRYLSMIKRHHLSGEPFGVVTLLQGFEVSLPEQSTSIASGGTLAKIIHFEELQPALFRIKGLGMQRFNITQRHPSVAGVERVDATLIKPDEEVPIPTELQKTADMLGKFIAHNQEQGLKLNEFPFSQPFRLDECGWVANRWAEMLNLERAQKLELLLETEPLSRLEKIKEIML